jgi:putative FmdB family regulatory protein
MPIFEYVCQQCNHQFEAIVMSKQKAACSKTVKHIAQGGLLKSCKMGF